MQPFTKSLPEILHEATCRQKCLLTACEKTGGQNLLSSGGKFLHENRFDFKGKKY
jgi:hypothetical protein